MSAAAAQSPREYRGGLSLFASNQPCGSADTGLGGACGSVDVARRDDDGSRVTAADAGGLNLNMYKPNRDFGGTWPTPPPLPTERKTGAEGLCLARKPGRRDQEPGPEPERWCRRRHRMKSSTMPLSIRRRRSELRTRPTMRPALSEFRDVDAVGVLVGVSTLLLGMLTVDVACGSTPDVGHGTDEN